MKIYQHLRSNITCIDFLFTNYSDEKCDEYQNAYYNKNVKNIQNSGFESFIVTGLPPNSKTSELWKYTNFHDLSKTKFFIPEEKSLDSNMKSEIFSSNNYETIYIVDGFFDAEMSNFSNNIIVEKQDPTYSLKSIKLTSVLFDMLIFIEPIILSV